jgi:hypothetical protein
VQGGSRVDDEARHDAGSGGGSASGGGTSGASVIFRVHAKTLGALSSQSDNPLEHDLGRTAPKMTT